MLFRSWEVCENSQCEIFGIARSYASCKNLMSPDRIVMISCNHATAARDCAVLEELGYKTVKVKGVDLFGRTGHVETVCLLSKK